MENPILRDPIIRMVKYGRASFLGWWCGGMVPRSYDDIQTTKVSVFAWEGEMWIALLGLGIWEAYG